MEGAVQEWSPDCGSTEFPELVQQLLREVGQLRQETVELRAELADVRRENLELRQQAGYWRAMDARAVYRKNYYGSGALWSGNLAAMLFSIFATLELWSLNPREWLTRYLQGCAENGGRAPADVTPFLPWNISANTSIVNPLAPSGSS